MTGLLPIATGKATRIVQTLLPAGKEYVCVMHIHKKVTEEEIRKAVESFVGEIDQLPPIKSAVKRQWRKRNIYYINIIETDGQDVLFRVGCEAGTYIRKLCLHPQTELPTTDGIINAAQFFLKPSTIYSFKKGKLELKKPTAVQKIASPRELLRIKTSSGILFNVTSDHELLKSTEEGYAMTEAKKLKVGDFLVKSLKYEMVNKEYAISDLLDENYLITQKEIKEKCKLALIKKYGSIRSMYRTIKIDRKPFFSDSDIAISIRHLKIAGIYDSVKSKIKSFKTEKGTTIELTGLNKNHFYLLGLIASDGNNTKEKNTIRHTRLKFHNKDEKLIDIFVNIYRELFPTFNITKKKLKRGIFQLDTSNSFFATIAASFGIKSPYKSSDILPILYSKPENIEAFLKGYFDGDGTCWFKKKKNKSGVYTTIAYATVNYTTAKRIHQMLLKLNIPNNIFKLKNAYTISIGTLAAKHSFIERIGANSLHKKEILNKILTQKNANTTDDNYYVALHYKNYLYESRQKLTKLGGNLFRVLNSKVPITRYAYNRCSKIVPLPKLDEFIIEKIVSIEPTKGEGFVYDMTVSETHNFLIETGFVSSNCDDLGKKLDTGAHMAELVRTKVGPFTYETMITLQDLKDAYEIWKESGDEKEIRKIIQPMENAIAHLPKIWIFDTTVDSMSHGADLSVPGIAKLHSGINHDDLVAVMTLKDELVCLGEAVMNSQNIHMQKRGIAIKTRKVFYERGVYPKFVRNVPETTPEETQ